MLVSTLESARLGSDFVLPCIPFQRPGDENHQQGKRKAQANDNPIAKPLRERRDEFDLV